MKAMLADLRLTLGKEGSFTFTEKKSVFCGYASPVNTETEALAFIQKIKKGNADARHNVSAYVCSGASHASDDGEPQGTGGVPVLDVIRKNGLDGVACVVARYFGGILLGAGGLVRAYSRAAAGAVADAGIVRLERFAEFGFSCGYGDYERLLFEIGKFTSVIDSTEFGSEVAVRGAVRSGEFSLLVARLGELTGGKITIIRSGERFDAVKERKTDENLS